MTRKFIYLTNFFLFVSVFLFGQQNQWSWPTDYDPAKVVGSFSTNQDNMQHCAIDIFGIPGFTNVQSIYYGQVVYKDEKEEGDWILTIQLDVDNNGIYNNQDHYYAVYSHCVNVVVNYGDPVTPGQDIAKIGHFPITTPFDHLNLEFMDGTPDYYDWTFEYNLDPLMQQFAITANNQDPGSHSPALGPLFIAEHGGDFLLPATWVCGNIDIVSQITDNMGHIEPNPSTGNTETEDELDAWAISPMNIRRIDGVISSPHGIKFCIRNEAGQIVFPLNTGGNPAEGTVEFSGHPMPVNQFNNLFDIEKLSFDDPYYYYCYKLTNITPEGAIVNNSWNTLNCKDGKYSLNLQASDLLNSSNDNVELLVDNYVPYIQKVEVYLGSTSNGNVIYSGEWSPNTGGTKVTFDNSLQHYFLSAYPGDNLFIKVKVSEPLSNLSLSINGFTGCTDKPGINENPNNKSEFVFSITPQYTQNLTESPERIFTMNFKGTDYNGHYLDEFSSPVNSPDFTTTQYNLHLHNYDNTWSPAYTAGQAGDSYHKFKFGCSSNKSSGECVSSGFTYTGNPSSFTSPVQVTFTNTSYGAIQWEWDFGDGGLASASTQKNPVHIFYNSTSSPITYTVTLKAIDNAGHDNTYQDDITINPPTTGLAPVANFTANQTILTRFSNETVTFYDLSTNNPTEWLWILPGTTYGTSTLQNPTVVYDKSVPNEGQSYTVTLQVTNANGSNTKTETNFITKYLNTPPPDDLSLYGYTYQFGNVVTFQSNIVGNPQSVAGDYHWIIYYDKTNTNFEEFTTTIDYTGLHTYGYPQDGTYYPWVLVTYTDVDGITHSLNYFYDEVIIGTGVYCAPLTATITTSPLVWNQSTTIHCAITGGMGGGEEYGSEYTNREYTTIYRLFDPYNNQIDIQNKSMLSQFDITRVFDVPGVYRVEITVQDWCLSTVTATKNLDFTMPQDKCIIARMFPDNNVMPPPENIVVQSGQEFGITSTSSYNEYSAECASFETIPVTDLYTCVFYEDDEIANIHWGHKDGGYGTFCMPFTFYGKGRYVISLYAWNNHKYPFVPSFTANGHIFWNHPPGNDPNPYIDAASIVISVVDCLSSYDECFDDEPVAGYLMPGYHTTVQTKDITIGVYCDATIQNGAQATYTANNEITLGDGFTVEEGSDVTIQTIPCQVNYTQYCGSAKEFIADSETENYPAADTLQAAVPAIAGISETHISYTLQASPNPFDELAHIRYEVPQMSNIELAIYSIYGQKLYILVNEQQQPGTYMLNVNTAQLTSGVYFCILKNNTTVEQTIKLIKSDSD